MFKNNAKESKVFKVVDGRIYLIDAVSFIDLVSGIDTKIHVYMARSSICKTLYCIVLRPSVVILDFDDFNSFRLK